MSSCQRQVCLPCRRLTVRNCSVRSLSTTTAALPKSVVCETPLAWRTIAPPCWTAREAEGAGGAGDAVAAGLEADAHTGSRRADERGGGLGCAECVGEEGGLIRATEQGGACEEGRRGGQRDDERENQAQAKLPR